jgi:hypothetical protein
VNAVVCPECRSESVHLGTVAVAGGFFNVKVSGDGEVKRGALSAHGRRGSVVGLVMWCESGHMFCTTYAFHKGSTTVATEMMDSFNPIKVEPVELWRD